MKKILFVALFLFTLSACQESLEDRCEREAKEFTRKNCPSKMDETIIIDSLTFDRKTHTLSYYYKLCGKADHEGIIEEIDAVGVLKRELKNATTLKAYKDAGYNFNYIYRSGKDPKTIWLDLTLTKKDYEQ